MGFICMCMLLLLFIYPENLIKFYPELVYCFHKESCWVFLRPFQCHLDNTKIFFNLVWKCYLLDHFRRVRIEAEMWQILLGELLQIFFPNFGVIPVCNSRLNVPSQVSFQTQK